jgi:rhodanese-related sulfurtransferase
MSKSSKTKIKQIIENITPITASKLIEKHRNDSNFIILDVRTREEFTEEHIQGAENLDYYSRDFREQLEKMDKEKKYLIYCASGGRGNKAMEMMEELDFLEVYNIEGGFTLWCINNLQ